MNHAVKLGLRERVSTRVLNDYRKHTNKIIEGSVVVENATLYWFVCCFGEDVFIFTSIDETTWRLDKKCNVSLLEKELKGLLWELADEAIKNELAIGWSRDNQFHFGI